MKAETNEMETREMMEEACLSVGDQARLAKGSCFDVQARGVGSDLFSSPSPSSLRKAFPKMPKL